MRLIAAIRRKAWLIVLMLAGFGLTMSCIEIILWKSGFGDFPLYDTDPAFGYIPKPLDGGNFRGRYSWTINEYSMRNEPFDGRSSKDILLIGDSIVFGGGIDYTPSQRLGACLQRELPSERVWSIGAGSWALLNEHSYLQRTGPVVELTEKIYWLVNWKDFGDRSVWASDLVHPRQKPLLLSYYLLMKWSNSKGWLAGAAPPARPYLSEAARDVVQHLASDFKGKVVLIWFPTKAELAKSEEVAAVEIKSKILSLADEKGIPVWDLLLILSGKPTFIVMPFIQQRRGTRF